MRKLVRLIAPVVHPSPGRGVSRIDVGDAVDVDGRQVALLVGQGARELADVQDRDGS